MSDEQTVATAADEQGNPVSEAPSAQDELDAALAEFDSAEATQTQEQTNPTPSQDDLGEVVSYIKAQQTKELQDSVDAAIGDAVKIVSESLETSMDAETVEALLNLKAGKDERFQNAFKGRGNNPDAWNRALKAFAKGQNEKAKSQPDPTLSADQDAVAAAVHSAATRSPAPEVTDGDIMSMSKGDFAKLQRSMGVNPN